MTRQHRNRLSSLFSKTSSPVRARTYRRALFEPLEPRMVLTAPTLAAIPEITMYAGVPMYVALDGYDADGDTLSFTPTTTSSRLTTSVQSGNHSMQVSVTGYGTMTFQLFEDIAGRPAERIIELAQGHFYDNVKFHRIMSNFVTQGGDPTGTGSGSSPLGTFDDQYHVDLRHSTAGVLSMAKSKPDDTNDCQFYITNSATPDLDQRYSVFGFLVEGNSVRQAIASVPVGYNSLGEKSVPLQDVVMNSVSIVEDGENGVLILKTDSSFVGTAYVTVVATDGQGGTAQQTFRVNVLAPSGAYAPAAYNPPPFLGDIAPIWIRAGQSYDFTIPAQDPNGDSIYYLAQLATETSLLNVNYSANTGQARLTANAAASGVYSLQLRVASSAAYLPLDATQSYYHDTQYVPVYVLPQTPTVDLLDISDTGLSQTDNVTDLNNTPGKTLQFRVSGVASGAIVSLYVDGRTTPIGQAEAFGSEVVVETDGSFLLGDGIHQFTAVQTLENRTVSVGNYRDTVNLSSDPSGALTVAIGTVPPQFTSTPLLVAFPGIAYLYDAETSGEASANVRYALTKAVAGMTVNDLTGRLNWTPATDQVGVHEIILRATDLFGDYVEQSFHVSVIAAPEIEPIADQSLLEGQSLSFTVQTDDDHLPLTFGLENAPQGAAIDSQTGQFTWTTDETHGPGEYQMTVVVTNSAGAVARQTFTVAVAEENSPPQMNPIGNLDIDEGEPLSFLVVATDADLPAHSLWFRLAEGAPEGAQIDPQTGNFTWTPDEAQGPGEYEITVSVSDSEEATASTTFTVTVHEVASPPLFEPIGAQTVKPGQPLHLVVAARDTDSPGLNTIVYSLETNAPDGLTVNAQTGELDWTVPERFPAGSLDVLVRATEFDPAGQAGASGTLSIRVKIESSPAAVLDLAWMSFVGDSDPMELRARNLDPEWLHSSFAPIARGSRGPGLLVSGTYDDVGLLGPRLASHGGSHGVRQAAAGWDLMEVPQEPSESGFEEGEAENKNTPYRDDERVSRWSAPQATDVVLDALEPETGSSSDEPESAQQAEAKPQPSRTKGAA